MHLKNSLLSLTFPKGRGGSNKVLQTGPDEPHSEAKPAELRGRGSRAHRGSGSGPTDEPQAQQPPSVLGDAGLATPGAPPSSQPGAAEMDRGALGQSPLRWAPDSPSLPSASWGLGVSIAYPQGRPPAQGPDFPITGPGPGLCGREQAHPGVPIYPGVAEER